jgi:chromosome segregation ATPase
VCVFFFFFFFFFSDFFFFLTKFLYIYFSLSLSQREIDRLLVEATERDAEFDRLRTKYEASTARVAALDRDAKRARDRIAVLVAKSRDDDELIDTLKAGLHEAAAAASARKSSASSAAKGTTVARTVHDNLKERYVELCGRVETQEHMIEALQQRNAAAAAAATPGAATPRSPARAAVAAADADPDPAAVHLLALPAAVAAALRAFAGGEIALMEKRAQRLDELAEHLRAKAAEAEDRESDLRRRLTIAEKAAAAAGSPSARAKQRRGGAGPDDPDAEERCEMLRAEVDALKLSLRGAAQRREKEMRMYRDMADEARGMCAERLAEIARAAGVSE